MKITDKISKPSEALQAMVDGLVAQSGRRDFVIDMNTFGSIKGGLCFGCAATCTIQQIAGRDLGPDSVVHRGYRAQLLGFDRLDLADFEEAIDEARNGHMKPLCRYFDVPHRAEYDGRVSLYTRNWESGLPSVEALIAELEEEGV